MIIVTVVVIVSLFLFEMIRTLSNPLHQSDNQLRSNLLKRTPLGTSMNEVVNYIKSKKNWEIEYIDPDEGFIHPRKVPREMIGVKSIRVFIGEYSSIFSLYFSTSVTVFYGFNEKSELIDIWVWKDIDAI